MTSRWPRPWDSKTTALAFYGDLITFILDKDPNLIVVLNSGTAYYEEYILGQPPNVKAVIYETRKNKYHPDTDCLSLLRTDVQGSYSPGPWCRYVPNYDGIESLKQLSDDGTILATQTAVLMYEATDPSEVQAIINDGIVNGEQRVGWIYVTDRGGWEAWSGVANDPVWDALVTAL